MPLLSLGGTLLEPRALTSDIVHFNPWTDFNDGPPTVTASGCDPDPDQISTFLDTVFSWCEGLIPLRGFVDKGQGRDGKPHNIWIAADTTAREKLATFAAWANREGAAVYVIPGTVAETGQARAAEVLQMQALVVDLDAQACATFSLGLDPEDLDETGADVFMSREPQRELADLVVRTADGVDLPTPGMATGPRWPGCAGAR